MASTATDTAVFHITFPVGSVIKTAAVSQPLIWWNTHYKNRHEWDGGRVEVMFCNGLKGYDQQPEEEEFSSEEEEPVRRHVSFHCPHCHKPIWFWVDYLDEKKGHVKCWGCKGQFGTHPNGQLFVVRDSFAKEKVPEIRKDKVMKWLNWEAHYNDWDIEHDSHGVTVTIREPQSKEDYHEEVNPDGLTVRVRNPASKLEAVISDLRAELASRGISFREEA